MGKEYILAIDQGTSGSKAVVFDTTGHLVVKASAPLCSLFPQTGFVEQDPEEILTSVTEAVKQCLSRFTQTTGLPLEAIRVCGISNQRETLVLWDESGKPLHNAVVWQCKRSVEICNRLKGTAAEAEITKRTGLIADPYFSGTKVIWLYRNDPAVKAAIDAKRALFGTVDAWLLYRLTGGKSYKTDYTNACRTLFFNIDTLDWDQTLLRKFKLQNLRLPEALPSSSPFGETDFGGLLPAHIPIGGMIGDSHASAFGQACFTPGSAKVTMGTGSSVLMNTGSTRRNSKTGMMTTICWSTRDRVDYAFEGIIVSCGSTLTWLKDQLGVYSDVKELAPLAVSIPSNEGVYLIPAFSGLGGPHWKMDAKASIQGLTFGSTKAHVVRAALESIAFQLKDVIAAMERDAGIKLRELVADGGITKDAFVMQFCADLLNARVVQRGIEEVSALGAACMAGLQAGLFARLEDLGNLEATPRAYTPNADRSVVLDGYKGWRKAVKRV